MITVQRTFLLHLPCLISPPQLALQKGKLLSFHLCSPQANGGLMYIIANVQSISEEWITKGSDVAKYWWRVLPLAGRVEGGEAGTWHSSELCPCPGQWSAQRTCGHLGLFALRLHIWVLGPRCCCLFLFPSYAPSYFLPKGGLLSIHELARDIQLCDCCELLSAVLTFGSFS